MRLLKKYNWLLFVAGFASTLVAYNYKLLGIDEQWFYKMIAVALEFFFLFARVKADTNNYPLLIAADISIPLGMGNLYDEFFGDPCNVGWHEYTGAVLAIIWTIYDYSKHRAGERKRLISRD